MRATLDLLRRVWLPVLVAGALGFGATEALAGVGTVQCNAPGTCQDNDDCDQICEDAGFMFGGTCTPQNCCECLE